MKRESTTLSYRMLACATIWLAGFSTCVIGDDMPPNVVLILADDLGWADLGCYGADAHQTPHIDRMAEGGVRFTQAYSAAPVCSPTRASIMAGKHPARLNITIWLEGARRPPRNRALVPPLTEENLPLAEVTLAERFRAAGHATAHIGKWHLGNATHYPEAQGFDLNIGGTLWGAPSTFNYPYRGEFGNSGEIRYVPHLEFGREGEYLTDRLTDEALRFIERSADRPFFLNLWHHAVHTPIEAPPPIVEKYRAATETAEHHRNATFAAMVETLDTSVGRILDKLDELHLSDRTLVIFTSDNGGYINEYEGAAVTDNYPLRSGKGSLYEGGIRVPLLARWPGVVAANATCDEPVVSTDLYRTIVEMAKLGSDEDERLHEDGVSLAGLLQDPTAKLAARTLTWHYPHYYATTSPASAIRQGNWKLIEYYEDEHVELYNLGDDPSEAHNVASAWPKEAQSLRDRLHAFLTEMDAQMPSRNAPLEPSPKRKKVK